jgi:hypothetical protein
MNATYEDLNKLYYGAQNASYEKCLETPPCDALKAKDSMFRREQTIVCTSNKSRHAFVLPNKKFSISCLKINSKFRSIDLEIGGLLIDRIYFFYLENTADKDGFYDIPFYLTSNGRIFPSLQFHDVHINVDFGDGDQKNAVLKYTEWQNPEDLDHAIDFLMMPYQWNANNEFYDDVATLEVGFNHPIFDIYMKGRMKSAILNLDNKFKAPFTYEAQSDRWSIVFQPLGQNGDIVALDNTVNFSKIDRATIEIVFDDGDNEKPQQGSDNFIVPYQSNETTQHRIVCWSRFATVMRIQDGRAGTMLY